MRYGLILCASIFACNNAEKEDESAETQEDCGDGLDNDADDAVDCDDADCTEDAACIDEDTAAADTDAEDTADGERPNNPSPFTLEISGAATESLVFDTPTCQSPPGSTNMRMFWRNAAREHAFVLIIEVMGAYTGPGSYGAADRGAIKMFEEAGGQGRSFASNDNTTSLEITFEIGEEDFIYGSAQVSSLFGDDGELFLNPSTLPIWCDEMN